MKLASKNKSNCNIIDLDNHIIGYITSYIIN